MRYFYERPVVYSNTKGSTYRCDHPVYNECTLYLQGTKGLAVIQQHFDHEAKTSWWGKIDPWLVDSLYFNPGFQGLFEFTANEPTNGLYPTITVRQLMWALKMKPLVREPWETNFDRKFI